MPVRLNAETQAPNIKGRCSPNRRLASAFAAFTAPGSNDDGQGMMAKRKRTTLGTIIDHDKAARLDRVQKLFFVRWLETHPLVKWAADFYYKHFYR